MTDQNTMLIAADGVLWPARRAWPAALAHLAKRFGRVQAFPDALLDDDRVVTADAIGADVAVLQAWASDDIPWQRTLERWFDEHMPMYARHDREVARSMRQVDADTMVVAWSALPVDAAKAALRHTGTLRHVDTLLCDIHAPSDLDGTVATSLDDALTTPESLVGHISALA